MLQESYSPRPTKEILEDYKEIDLTEDELDEAILDAKIKKERRIEAERIREREQENRRNFNLYTSDFSYEQMKGLALHRAGILYENKVFNRPFVLDSYNTPVFDLMCMYFSRDKRFEQMGYSLHKGICLAGIPGAGKSWLMKIFNKNPRQCFYIRDCKEISLRYQKDGMEIIEEFSHPIKAAVNDKDNYFKPQIGVCFSDLGTEDLKNSYGNKSNVIADILFERYKNNVIGDLTHGETNLTVPQIEDFYGARIRSRFSEMFNWIVLDGKDRRKS